MTRPRTSEVEVALDPAAAFAVFTQEIDYWWLRGPINNWDSARVREMRCEPGVGGRLLEIYDEAGDDVLELARITAWEPGQWLAWDSAVDDVHIDVRFEPTSIGTRVRLIATVASAGKDAGGTSFVRVAPTWFASWCQERNDGPGAIRETARLAVAIHYEQPLVAARWLRDVFGLRPVLELPQDDDADAWIEFRAGDSALIVLKKQPAAGRTDGATHVPWVFVDDLDAHFARSTSAGAAIRRGIQQHGYRAYEVEDLEGLQWVFAQARPTM